MTSTSWDEKLPWKLGNRKFFYWRKQDDDVYGTQSAPKIKISTVRSIEISQSNHPPPITGRFQLAFDRL